MTEKSPVLFLARGLESSIRVVKILLDVGAAITDTDEGGNTVLHHLSGVMVGEWCDKSPEKIIQYIEKFISSGIDINYTKKAGENLLLSSFFRHAGCCMEIEEEAPTKSPHEKMLEAGIHPTVVSMDGQNLLHVVSNTDTSDIVNNGPIPLRSFERLMRPGQDLFKEDKNHNVSDFNCLLFSLQALFPCYELF
jgi:hypothetical protein